MRGIICITLMRKGLRAIRRDTGQVRDDCCQKASSLLHQNLSSSH